MATSIPPALVAALACVAGVGAYTADSVLPAIILPGTFAVGYLLSKLLKAGNKALHPVEWRDFELVEKRQISPNTAIYRYALQTNGHTLGLPIGQHISISATVDGKEVARSYTPISSEEDVGYFELLIKTYPGGAVSTFVDTMVVGDKIRVRGPKGNFLYTPNICREFGMIAGGTGITPMLQVIKAILRNPADKTKISLIFANVNESDILLRDELDSLALKHADQFKVHYVLNNPPEGWTGGVGFVTKDMIEKYMPKPASDIKILLCGPLPMIKAMTAHTTELGYDKPNAISKMEDMVFKF